MVKGVEAQVQAILHTLQRAEQMSQRAVAMGFLGQAFNGLAQSYYAAKVKRQVAKLPDAQQIQLGEMGHSLESLSEYAGHIPQAFRSELCARELLAELSRDDPKWTQALASFNRKLPQVESVWNQAVAQGLTGSARDDFETADGASRALHRAAFQEKMTGQGLLQSALDKFQKAMRLPSFKVLGGEEKLGELSRELGGLQFYPERAKAAKTQLDQLIAPKFAEKPKEAVSAFDAASGKDKGAAIGQLLSVVEVLQGSEVHKSEFQAARSKVGSYIRQLASDYDTATSNLGELVAAARGEARVGGQAAQSLNRVLDAAEAQKAAFTELEKARSMLGDLQDLAPREVATEQEQLELEVKGLPAEIRGVLEGRRGELTRRREDLQDGILWRTGRRELHDLERGIADRELNGEDRAKAVHEKALAMAEEARREAVGLAKEQIEKLDGLPEPLKVAYDKLLEVAWAAGKKLKDVSDIERVTDALLRIIGVHQSLLESRAKPAGDFFAGADKTDMGKISPYYHNLSMDPTALLKEWETLSRSTQKLLRSYLAHWDKFEGKLSIAEGGEQTSIIREEKKIEPRGVSAVHVSTGQLLLDEVRDGLNACILRVSDFKHAEKRGDEETGPALEKARDELAKAKAVVAEDDDALKALDERATALDGEIEGLRSQLEALVE